MRVLFLVNGLGLGNSARCHAIIQRLHASGAHIEMVTSGNGLWYFSDKPEVARIYEIEPLAYGSKDGAISILRTLASVPGMINIIRRNMAVISTALEESLAEAIVIDSDYNLLPMKKPDIPVIALNNADVVVRSAFRLKARPASILPQLFAVEIPDSIFHRIVPDLVLSPELCRMSEPASRKIRRIGPIVRDGFGAPAQPGATPNIVVMLSGSNFGTAISFESVTFPYRIDVIGRSKPDGMAEIPGVTFHGKVLNVFDMLAEADLAVVNGGFSAVSEMFCLRKPVVVVPVPRHAEQWVNAATMAHLGVGEVGTEADYELAMLRMADEIEHYRTAYAGLPEPADGAGQASQAVLEAAAGADR